MVTLQAQTKPISVSLFKFTLDIEHKTYVNLNTTQQFKSLQTPIHFKGFNYNIKTETAKGAIFCRMENASRDKLNVWLKIHAGNGSTTSEGAWPINN
jgi:hypothetical protein